MRCSRSSRSRRARLRGASAFVPRRSRTAPLLAASNRYPARAWSGPVERKREHFVYVAGADSAHHEAIEAERHSGTLRQSVLQRCEEVLIDRHGRQTAALAL